MKRFEIQSTDELKAVLLELGDNILFRGQTSHYENEGVPSIVTSFDRRGCIPPLMLKWSRYASNLLEDYIGPDAQSTHFTQALLQHYGWRSFYIDCSSNAAVSAWFASHTYKDDIRVELCEDYEERPVFLRKRMAQYCYTEETGHLYVLDKNVCSKTVGLIDLASINLNGARPRTAAQDAWLLGPLRKESVPHDCLIAHINGPRQIFREFAAAGGVTNTDRVFPSSDEDPILAALLGIPWKEIALPNDGINIPGFLRGLDIPEYQDSYQKIVSPAVAFYRGEMIGKQENEFPGKVVAVPEECLFGSPDAGPARFPNIEKLANENHAVAFEINDLISLAQLRGLAEYQKGIVVIAHGQGLFEVCQLVVEHPGLDLIGVGVNVGWYYRVGKEGFWVREANEKECPCGHGLMHQRYFEGLKIIEQYLEKPGEFR